MSNSHFASNPMTNPKVRRLTVQIGLALVLILLGYLIFENVAANLRRTNINSGFAFLRGRAGFEIAQPLIPYTGDSTYARALFVGLLNTMLVAISGSITATIIGFAVGIGRLSQNWLIAKLCTAYVEVFRNLPPLVVVFFWYLGILQLLPPPRQSIHLPLGSYLNNRGLTFPAPLWGPGIEAILVGFGLAVVAACMTARWARKRQAATGKPFHTIWAGIALVAALPLLTYFVKGAPLSFDFPLAGTFNLRGGSVLGPEFLSLYLALSFYTASYIAEIVRSGINGVPRGQSEAAKALGLGQSAITRLVIIPQAFRIIIPPLTSQYLNLTKNSSLAIAVGFSDLVAVGGTTLNQTGQAVEIIVIWMVCYLGLSVMISISMNWFNAKMALVER